MDVLLALRAAGGATLIVASRRASVVARCERIVRLFDGRVIRDDPVSGPDPDATFERITGPA
jgi:putative ABC transport system ATP-binding protein